MISLFRSFSRTCALRFLVLTLWVLLVLAACGGGTGGNSPRSADDTSGPEEGDATSGSTESGYQDGETTPEAIACNDETCFPCGDGMCPTGFFCDQDAGDGPGCSWLPECAETATCDCVVEVLGSGCSCQDAGGGPSVSCG